MKTEKISSFFRKVLSVINQTLMLLTVPVLLVGLVYILFFGLGIFMIYWVMASIYERKGDIYPFFRPNSMYGVERTVYRTVEKSKDILNSDGVKVGSIVSKEVEEDSESDIFQYTPIAPFWKFAIYILFYPIMRVVSLFASIISLFTKKFYVQVSAPADFTPVKYNAFLFCYFDIVYKRNEKEIDKYYDRKISAENRKAARAERKKKIKKDDIVGVVASFIFLPITILVTLFSTLQLLANLDNPEKRKVTEYDLKICGIAIGLWCILLLIGLIIYLFLR